jgi:hypothetical protein
MAADACRLAAWKWLQDVLDVCRRIGSVASAARRHYEPREVTEVWLKLTRCPVGDSSMVEQRTLTPLI